MADFVALAERVSGKDLRQFFDVWLYQPDKPPGLSNGSAVSGSGSDTPSGIGSTR
jgi:aminopeptidase N